MEREESLGAASFQAQHERRDPKGQAVRSSSLYDLGGSPALFQDAESSSSLGQGGAPALQDMHDDKSSVSNSASSLEGHMSSRHKLSNVVTQLSIVVTCLQDCISTLVELQSDSFNQQDADAYLGMRESSLGSLTSSRNIGHNNNSNKTQEKKRSSLGELTPRTCRSKSEETGSHPELEHDELEQEEAKQQKSKNKQKQDSLLHNKRVQQNNNNDNNNNNKSLRRSKSSFQDTKDGATYAGRKDTQQKLAGITTSHTSSTTQLGKHQASCSNSLRQLQ